MDMFRAIARAREECQFAYGVPVVEQIDTAEVTMLGGIT